MFNWLKSLLTRKPPSDRDFSALLGYGPQYLPFTAAWTDSRVEQVKHFKNFTYTAINHIATTVADDLPNVSYVKKSKDDPNSSRRKSLVPIRQGLEPVPDNHPLLRLLLDPNDPDTSYDLWYESILFLLLTGSCYWWAPKRPGFKVPEALWVVPSHWVWPVVGKTRLIEAWEIRPTEGNYGRKTLPADEVVVFRRKNPLSKIDGYSPLTASAQWVDTAEMVDRSKWFAYKNGTFPSVAVQFDGSLHDPSDEDLRRIEQKFIARHVGETRANKPLFLPPGVKVIPLTIKPNEMIFGQTSREMRDYIFAAFGIPTSLLFDDGPSTYGSKGAARYVYHDQCVNPLRRFFSQVINEKLCPLYKGSSPVKVWWKDSLPLDPVTLEKAIQTDLMAGAISRNEIRVLRGREPWDDPEFDKPVLPANMVTTPRGGDNESAEPPVSDTPNPKVSEETSLNGYLPPANNLYENFRGVYNP